MAVAILQPRGWASAASALFPFISPDRRWPFSPSALVPPSGRPSHRLAQRVLAAVVAAAALPALRATRAASTQAGRAV